MTAFFSGEPLPIAPILARAAEKSLAGTVATNFLEIERFHAKLLEYLRRLGLHLSNPGLVPGGETNIETMCLYRDTNQTSLVQSSFDDVEWDGQIRVDAAYTHDSSTAAGSEVLHFNRDGFYLMWFNLRLDSNSNFQTRLVDPDNSDQVLSWSLGHTDALIANIRPMGQAIPFHAHVGQNLVIQINCNDSGELLLANHCRLNVIRLGELLGGGESPIDPCILEPWQLYC